MTHTEIILFLNNYGIWFMFAVVFIEYLNFPGFPAGVIFPAVGLWADATNTSFILVFAISILAGLMGSMVLYVVGRVGGVPLLEKIYVKFPSIRIKIFPYEEKLKTNSAATVFISKLIPVVRTLIGFPAGVVQMNLPKYLLFSGLGISIWNGTLLFAGTAISSIFIN